jgi:hypothetical protein
MKQKKKNLLDLIMISLVIIGLFRTSKPMVVEYNQPAVEEICNEEVCEIEDVENPSVKLWFDYTYDRFEIYNKDIDTASVDLFIRVADHYGFTKDSVQYRLIVGQILLESGANQTYYKGHPYEGQLVVSYAGAVGRTQILPSTAYHFMSKILSEDDVRIFKNFGASDFSFATDDELTKRQKIQKAKEWLSDNENNIIMWGYIMRHNMSKTGNNIIKSLIAYNAGRGGLNMFMKRGNSIYDHDYVKGIYNRLARVERKIA